MWLHHPDKGGDPERCLGAIFMEASAMGVSPIVISDLFKVPWLWEKEYIQRFL